MMHATSSDGRDDLQRRLARFNQARWRPGLPQAEWQRELDRQHQLLRIEGEFLEQERAAVADRVVRVPTRAHTFIEWFETLLDEGPGQHDPLFTWLAARASLQELRWFLAQEIAGEAGFDDLVALTQVRMPVAAKLEMARNYWDEMGRGREVRMHGPMLQRCAKALGLRYEIDATVWESLALANLMAGLAANRRYAYHAVGALGAVELTAPSRVVQVDRGLRRLGVPAAARAYFSLHARIDVLHSRGWNEQVIRPLVAANPALCQPIAEGALMRLNAGARCFARYRRHLGVVPGQHARRTAAGAAISAASGGNPR